MMMPGGFRTRNILLRQPDGHSLVAMLTPAFEMQYSPAY